MRGASDILPTAKFAIRKGMEDMIVPGTDPVIITLPGPKNKRIEVQWRRATGDLAIKALSGALVIEPISSNVVYVGVRE